MNTPLLLTRHTMVDEARVSRLKIVIQEAAEGSQKELARLAGITEPDISRLLKGEVGKRGRLKKFNAIQTATGYSAEWLESGRAPIKIEGSKTLVESLSDSEQFANYMANSLIGITELAERLGKAPSTVSDYQKPGRHINDKLKEEIADALDVPVHTVFPVTTGYTSDTSIKKALYRPVEAIEEEMVALPFIPVKARAGFNYSQFWDNRDQDTYLVRLSVLRENYLKKRVVVIEIDGDSMEPTLYSGYKLTGYEVDKDDWWRVKGAIAILFEDEFVVKRVKDNDLIKTGFLTLHSDNPIGGTLSIPVDKIETIWKLDEFVGGKVR